MRANVKGKVVEFTKETDGWYLADGYAINPKLTECTTYPWYADHICDAPSHEFKIISE